MSAVVDVQLGAASYEAHVVEGLAPLGALLARVVPTGPVMVVSPPPVRARWGEEALSSLCGAGFAPVLLSHEDGEGAKRVAGWEALLGAALEAGLRRDTPILALGGGVTGDLAGFVAATAHRGVPFVQVPTTLLAMVDSSVGGKVAINAPQGKNLIGAFYQPRLVVAPVDCLASLPAAHRASGLGEVLKHAALEGPLALEALEAAAPALRAGDPAAWIPLVAAQLRFKAGVVARDEREAGERALLNLGHTVGHAIEAALGGALPHGLCVAYGLIAEARWAEEAGLGAPGLSERLAQVASALDLPLEPLRIDFPTLFRYMARDKKRGRATLSLPVICPGGRAAVLGLEDTALVAIAEHAARSLALPAAP